jgi:hypothetical protein
MSDGCTVGLKIGCFVILASTLTRVPAMLMKKSNDWLNKLLFMFTQLIKPADKWNGRLVVKSVASTKFRSAELNLIGQESTFEFGCARLS